MPSTDSTVCGITSCKSLICYAHRIEEQLLFSPFLLSAFNHHVFEKAILNGPFSASYLYFRVFEEVDSTKVK